MHFLASLLRIVIIDLALSGDNAVVIGMAAHRLPPKQRKTAILIGGGAAIGLRIVLTIIAAFLLLVPGLELVGGLLLIWIGFRLLEQEEESHEGIKVASNMKEAVTTILIADFIMSTDNVLGVAGASEGNIGLLFFGLVLSMAILMFMGNLVAELLNRFWWLAYVGSGVIAWTGTLMFIKDPLIGRYLPSLLRVNVYIYAVVITIGTLAAAHWYHRVRDDVSNSSSNLEYLNFELNPECGFVRPIVQFCKILKIGPLDESAFGVQFEIKIFEIGRIRHERSRVALARVP